MDRITKHNLVSEYKKKFLKEFKKNPDVISVAPGRINIIGEHTDYNQGFAIPSAVDKWILTLLSKRDDKLIEVYSINYKKKNIFKLNELDDKGDLWERYVKATLYVINNKYNLDRGYNILIGGNIPIGFGMSSSAALEVSIVSSVLNSCCLKCDKYEILKICNAVEKEILGINSGMLDQYASIFSIKNKFLLIDFLKLNHEYFDSNIQESCWVLINSMVSRELINTDYNVRVNECLEAINLINRKTNQKITFDSISIDDIQCIKNNKIFYNRLFHLITENQRVFEMKNAIIKGNLNEIGNLLNESHISLSKYYDVSCNEIESIISLSKQHKAFYGGRIMGGGFGGCTINLIDNNLKDDFIFYIKNKFFNKYNYNIEYEQISFCNGLEIVTN